MMKRLGTKVLAVLLLLQGLIGLLHLSFAYSGMLLAVLALVAGILLLLEK